jgi:hypothetical protein
MSDNCPKLLNLPIYPLLKSLDEYDLTDRVNYFSTSLLSLELLSFFENNEIYLEDNFVIFKGDTTNIPEGESYTDGDYFSEIHKRDCTIIWNFSAPNLYFKYYSTEGADHRYDELKDHTVWTNTSTQSCPDNLHSTAVLVNPQTPSVVKQTGQETKFYYVKLLFRENWNSLNEKLVPYIV